MLIDFSTFLKFSEFSNRALESSALSHSIRVFHDKIKFYILGQNLHQTCFNDFSNVKWCMKQTSI